jgi:tetratricopeptide (TPR) repeat protein
MQDAAYQSLLKSRRRELHRAAAEALAARAAAGAAEPPELLAQHFELAGELERAVPEWKRAGDRARHRHALAEAERHYTHAIELLAGLPETPERLQQELSLQIPLAVVLGVTRGYTSREHERSTSRAQALFARLGGAKGHAMALLSDAAAKIARGDVEATREAAERLLEAGLREGSRSAVTWAHFLTGTVAIDVGDLLRAQAHTEQAVACFREEDYAGSTIRPGPLIHGLHARILAERGFTEGAEAAIVRAIDLAERSDSPPDRFSAWTTSATYYVTLRDPGSTSRCCERANAALDLANRPLFWRYVDIFGAWARALQGEAEAAVAGLRLEVDSYRGIGPLLTLGQYLGLLAEAELLAGRAADGLATIEQAIAATPGRRIHLPELLRLRGELRAACEMEPALVESDLRGAVALACEMGARLSELRAATSLAHQLARHGRAAEGRELLAPLYAAFTEGFAARDLVEAKALLDELGFDAAGMGP